MKVWRVGQPQLPSRLAGCWREDLQAADTTAASLLPTPAFCRLDDNNLGPSLPSSILKLNQITHLNLNGNQLEQLPESLGTACPLIEELSIDGNRLTSLPESIGSMAGLKVLNLRGNKLESLPDSIGSLKSLQLLLVNSNRLKRLPRSMGGCTSLTTIQANCNQLVSLPGGLSQCGKLKKVRVILA